MPGLLAFNYNVSGGKGGKGGRLRWGGYPPLVRLKKYLGHLVSLDSREKSTWSLWAWLGLAWLPLPGNITLTVCHETCLYVCISPITPTSIAASATHPSPRSRRTPLSTSNPTTASSCWQTDFTNATATQLLEPPCLHAFPAVIFLASLAPSDPTPTPTPTLTATLPLWSAGKKPVKRA